jgi:hypothetical protein
MKIEKRERNAVVKQRKGKTKENEMEWCLKHRNLYHRNYRKKLKRQLLAFKM